MSSLEELDAAVEAASAWELPIVTTMSFDTNGSSMMGVSPGDFARWSSSHLIAITAVGANCGIGPADAVVAADEIRAVNADAWIVAKANCGIPALVDGELWYPASSDDMSSYARFAMDAGARIIGACCGSTPEHIAQIREVVDTYEPADGITLEDVESLVGEVARPTSRATGRKSGRRASS
jgi:5-methyltetrahydrofolate--homocysteine methyltransferase